MKPETQAAIDRINTRCNNLNRRIDQNSSDAHASMRLTNDAVQRLTRRVEALESAQAQPAQDPAGYDGWSNAQLLTALLHTGEYGLRVRMSIASEIGKRLDRVVDLD